MRITPHSPLRAVVIAQWKRGRSEVPISYYMVARGVPGEFGEPLTLEEAFDVASRVIPRPLLSPAMFDTFDIEAVHIHNDAHLHGREGCAITLQLAHILEKLNAMSDQNTVLNEKLDQAAAAAAAERVENLASLAALKALIQSNDLTAAIAKTDALIASIHGIHVAADDTIDPPADPPADPNV
jgi:hypothetical protein